MRDRKLDTSTGAGGTVAGARVRFDRHIDTCAVCEQVLCNLAQALWRKVCLTALRTQATKVGV